MSYDAIVYNVMIASPGDVASERNIVKEVIHEWNTIHSFHKKIVLLPIGWETHSSPEMGEKPQEIINQQVLTNCDLLVGVFWTKIGTETDKYASGSVEEIEKHIETGKPVMLYFSNKPAHPDSIDAEQYSKLKQFKTSCKDRGLYEVYDDLSSFKEKYFRHLQLKLNTTEYFGSTGLEYLAGNQLSDNDSNIPTLSEEARVLLKEASYDKNGVILYLRYLGGTDIQTNGKNLISNKDPRIIVKWEEALQALVNEKLVIERGYKGEIFEITSKGYQLADLLEI